MTEKAKPKRPQTTRPSQSKTTTEDTTFERLVVHLSDDPGKNSGVIRLIEQLGEIPISENYRVDAAREFGSGRWYAFTPRSSKGTFLPDKRWAAECFDTAPDADDDSDAQYDDADDELSAEAYEKIVARITARLRQLETPPSQSNGSLAEMVSALKQLDELRGKSERQQANGPVDFIGQLRQLEEVRRMFAPKEHNPTPLSRETELTTEQALLKLITEDPLALASAREKLLGTEGDGLGWLQIVQAFAPVLERGLTTLASAFASRSSGPTPANNQPGFAPPEQPPNVSAPVQAMSADMQAYQRLVGRLLSAMASNAEIDPVVTAIDGFCELFPEHQRMVEDLLNAPAESVLQFIGQNIPNAQPVTAAPHALDWMQRLQAAFTPSDENQKPNGESEKESEL